MSLVVKDRVRETTTTSGTGAVTLLGAVVGYQSFAAIGNGNSTYYTIADQGGANWEVGIGTYTASGTTLARTTVLASSNAGALVNFTAGSKDIFVTQPAERNVYVSGTSVVAENGATVPNTLLANSSLTLGSTALTLGATTTSVAGLTLTGAAGTFTTMTATADSAFTSTGAVQLSAGTTAQRPAGAAGKLRFNSTTTEFEGYNGTSWSSVGGSTIVNDTATATNVYPLFAASTSGTAATVYTSNAKYLYKPSTGELQASALIASNGIVVNSQTIATDYTIATGNNGGSFGPVSVNSGITVTIASGSTWTVV